MPVVDKLSSDYEDSVTFVAIAWKSSFDKALARANELITSGVVRWGLDESENVFGVYGITAQPVVVLIVDGVIVDQWSGVKGEEFLTERLEYLSQFSA